MRTLLLAFSIAAAGLGEAQASDARYDERLAQAAAQIAASRMGDLRGGLEPGSQLVLVEDGPSRPERAVAERPAPPGVWHDGLAIAVERRSTVSPEL